jgi:hypothetical protein
MKFHLFKYLVVISLFLVSCSNEFELTEQGEDVPVVYGVISAQDTALYIRVEKSFVSETVSGNELALDPKNLYYDDIQVMLKHTKTGKDFTLRRVDGNKEGYQRDQTGVFANSPNYLYKIKRSEINLIPSDEYQIIVKKSDGQILTNATTPILNVMTDAKQDVNPKPSATLAFGYTSDFKVEFFPDNNSVIHDIILTINYREIDAKGIELRKSVDWVAGNNTSNKVGANNYSHSVKGISFYQFLGGNIPANDPANPVTRRFDNITLKIVSGSQAIKDYISIGQINLGITSSGEIPVYSNLSNGARGLFASKATFVREGMAITNTTMDSLRNGIYTRQLNFK